MLQLVLSNMTYSFVENSNKLHCNLNQLLVWNMSGLVALRRRRFAPQLRTFTISFLHKCCKSLLSIYVSHISGVFVPVCEALSKNNSVLNIIIECSKIMFTCLKKGNPFLVFYFIYSTNRKLKNILLAKFWKCKHFFQDTYGSFVILAEKHLKWA